MKKILLTLGIMLGCHLVSAQAPEKMSYQAVMRNTTGQLLANQNIGVKVSVLQGSAAGAVVYSERLTGSTNINGLISLEIGTGTILSGTFPAINWASGNYWLKTETDPTGGTSYTITGTSQLLSVPYAMYAKSSGGGGGSLTLPFSASLTNAANLFDVTNNGDGTAISGSSGSTSSSISAINGTVTSTAPGGFSSAVRAINNGTGGLGIGVYGSQAGSGWGVYGTTPTGLGVYGNATGAGTGVFANSGTGTGLSATSTSGSAASFIITNNANNNNVISANTTGNGTVLNITTAGSGEGISSTTGNGFAVHGNTNQLSSTGIMGENFGGGEAVVGKTTSDIAGAVVGRNDGGGYGVRGFIATNTTGTGIGVFGQVGGNTPSTSGSTGRAGRFVNNNSTNIDRNTFEVETNGNGNIPDNTLGNASSFLVNNINSVGAAVRGEVKTIFGNFGAAGVFGVSSGTGGFAGLFHSSNVAGNGRALVAITDGNGDAIVANAKKDGDGVESTVNGTGRAIYGWIPTFGTGKAAEFQNFNDANNNTVVTATTVGNGIAGDFFVNNTNGTSAAVHGKINSQFSNFGTAGVYAESAGTGGFGGLFYASNVSGNGPALIAIANGNGNGITASAKNLGDGMESSITGSGNAVYGWVTNSSTGKAGRFENFNLANGNVTVHILNAGTGNALLINHSGTSGNGLVIQNNGSNVARIDKTGKGFFNNGTQLGGADLAEAFDVEGSISTYEAGDILVISTKTDRSVEKSSEPYSNLVAGVYATKPGVLLTEEHFESTLEDKVPMGVIGVIPTKVCLEGGAIKRGDLLVTSSISGVAMKADLNKVKIGQVLGKSLQDYTQNGIGKIKVLVSIK